MQEFRALCNIGGESLKRRLPPQGYDGNHPFIEDIKRKDFVGGRFRPSAEGPTYVSQRLSVEKFALCASVCILL